MILRINTDSFAAVLRPTLVHYLLGVEGVGVVGGHLLWRDARVLHRQVVYLVWVDDVFLRHSHIGWSIYCPVDSLVLRQFGSVALVTELAETTASIISGLIHLIQTSTSLILWWLLVA